MRIEGFQEVVGAAPHESDAGIPHPGVLPNGSHHSMLEGGGSDLPGIGTRGVRRILTTVHRRPPQPLMRRIP